MLLGHLVQITHILLVIAVMYLGTRTNRWWIYPACLGSVVIANLATGGKCPLTVLSNALLKDAGGVEYPSLAHWVGSFIGTPANHIFFALYIAIPLLAGYLVRRKKEVRSAALN